MSVICSECGRENDLPCNFCPGCGSKVVLGVSTNQDDKSEAPRVRFNDGEKPKSVGADLLAFPESQVREKLYTPNPKDQRDGNSRIRVVVRKRPLNSKEVQEDVIVVHSYNYMTLHEPKQRVDTTKYVEKHQYMFDEVDQSCLAHCDLSPSAHPQTPGNDRTLCVIYPAGQHRRVSRCPSLVTVCV